MRSTGIEMIRHYIDLSTEDTVDLNERYSMLLQQEKILLEKKDELEKQLAYIQHKKLDYEKELENK